MADTRAEIRIEAPPYKPSWIDRFTNWIETLPVHAWIFYVVLGFGLILVQMLFLWLDGGLQAGELLPVIIFNGFAVPFLLAQIHLLDNQAVTALSAMRPVFEKEEIEIDHYEYRLSNMPFLAPLIAGLVMMVFLIISERVLTVPIRYAALEGLPVFKVVYQIIDKSSAFLVGVFIYHTFRQLRLVDVINSSHIRVNLFNLRPLQAFSGLTASTAVGLVVFAYVWMFINPDLLTDPVSFGIFLIFTIFGVSIFVWPLYGVHRLMEMEKESELREINLLTEVTFAKFNQRLREDDYSVIDTLNRTIASLEIQHNRIAAIPTWPWKPETARFVVTAIALPLVLAILRFLVEQALGW